MSTSLRVLIVEDSEDDALLTARELGRGGYDVTFERVESPETMTAALARGPWDVVISDCTMPQFNAIGALELLREAALDVPFIVVSGTIDEESAVEALKAGAHDFLVKGKFARLGPAIERELREAAIRRDHRRAEEDLLKARAKSVELIEQSRRTEEANRLKSEFLANMSHELRTPLNSIIGFAELLHDGEVGPLASKQREFVGDILMSGRHLLQLINDVLDLSKVEAGRMEFHAEPIDLSALVAEVRSILRTRAAAGRIKVETSVSPDLGDVFLDPARLKQVLYNYVSNALKFTPDGGTVSIRAFPEGEKNLRLEVTDTGIGIKPDEMPRLFVEFQQLDSGTAKKHQGTGLGLALTRTLVEAQGGRVGLESTFGQGSTFYAILPRRHVGALPAPRFRGFAAAPAAGAPAILVVEDDPRDQEIIISALAGAGYSVAAVSTGADAIAHCVGHAFDAITLDLLLPDMSGLEVLQGIRSQGRNTDVPVVVITVVADKAVAGLVVQDVLQKPVAEAEVLAALRRAGVVPNARTSVAVIDDDPSSLKLMATTLEQLGYEAYCYGDARSGLDALRKLRPAAVIVDLLMPEMDGLAFVKEFRARPESRTIPVFVWTVKDLSQAERLSLLTQAQALIPKGHGGSSALLQTIGEYLGVRRAEAFVKALA